MSTEQGFRAMSSFSTNIGKGFATAEIWLRFLVIYK